MTRFMIAMGLCAVTFGCSHQAYDSKYPEVASNRCSINSSVFECNHRVPEQQAVVPQEAQVGAERGLSDEEAAKERGLERATYPYPSQYSAPNR